MALAVKNLKSWQKAPVVRAPLLLYAIKGEPFGWTENEERRKGSIFGFSSFFPQLPIAILPIAIATQPYDRVLCLDLVGEMSTPSSTPMNNEVINPFAYIRAVGTGDSGDVPLPLDFGRNMNKTIFINSAWINWSIVWIL